MRKQTQKNEDAPVKTGLDNKAFEDDKDANSRTKRIDNMINNTSAAEKENIRQSQIETGFTESMHSTSKL